MSHFSLIVIIPDEHQKIVERSHVLGKVHEMMAPYQENNGGDCPKKYLKFNDTTEKNREEWETEKMEMIKLSGGRIFSPYSNMFLIRQKPTVENGFNSSKYEYPHDSKKIEVLIREAYPDFDTYMHDYCGEKKDDSTGKYGYWENPAAKWDWFEMGGRWTGYFPTRVKDGFCGEPGIMMAANADPFKKDAIRQKYLDWNKVDVETLIETLKFWGQWQYFRKYKTDPSRWNEIRRKAVDIGLIIPKTASEITEEEKENAIHWKDYGDSGSNTNNGWDIYNDSDINSFDDLIKTRDHFFSPISPYAILDSEGWHAPGEMGWFACSTDQYKDRNSFKKSIKNRILNTHENDWLVCVDCHI